MKIFQLTLTFIVVCFAMANPAAKAAVTYNLRFDQGSLQLSPNQVATVEILFEENISAPDTFRLGADDGSGGLVGLFGAVFNIDRTGTGSSSLTSATAPTSNFSDSLYTINGPDSASISASLGLFDLPEIGIQTGNTRSISLGTLTITGGIGSNVFSLTDLGSSDDVVIADSFGGNFFVADSNINFGTLTVTAVPEPSSSILYALLGGAWAFRRRR